MSGELFMGGTRLYQQDQAQLAQMAANTALLQEKTRSEVADRELNPLKAELLRGQAAHQGTLADLNRAQAAEIAAKESREERVAAAIAQSLGKRRAPAEVQFDDEGNPMPQVEAEEGQGMADLASVGLKVMEAGDLAKGEKLVKLAADLKHKEAQTAASRAAEKVRLANTEVKKLEFMQEILSGVKSPEDHSRAVLLLRGSALTGQEPMPKWLETYDQAKINQFVQGSKAAIEKRKLAIQSFNADSADKSRKAAQEVREYLADLTKRRTDAYVERVANLGKAGGVEKAVPPPGSAELKLLRQELVDEGIEFESGEDDDAAVGELAEQVKIRTTRNTSLSRKAAIAQVLDEAKKRGDLVPGKPATKLPILGKVGGSKSKYNQTEGTVAMPLPVPADLKDLVVGNYYRGPDGRIEKWLGNGKSEPISVQTPKGKK